MMKSSLRNVVIFRNLLLYNFSDVHKVQRRKISYIYRKIFLQRIVYEMKILFRTHESRKSPISVSSVKAFKANLTTTLHMRAATAI